MPLKIRWFGAIGDSSGYANSSRNYIHSLSGYKDEIDLSVGRISFETEKTQHELTPLINSYVREDQQAKIQITHLTPENYEKFKNKHAYNIGYTAWETSVLPKDWPELCNQMDEIWVPSTWNVKVFKDSGVKKPIICIPHVVECEDISGIQPFDQKGENYWFYSIFQWCYDKETRVLTKNGFKYFKDLTYDDELATFNKETEELEYQKPDKIVNFHRKGKMLNLENQAFNFCVTPDHRMLVRNKRDKNWKLIPANELINKKTGKFQSQWRTKKNCIWKGKEEKYFVLSKIEKTSGPIKIYEKIKMDSFLELLGWYLSEGSTHTSNGYYIDISQKTSKKYIQEIYNIVEKCGYTPFYTNGGIRFSSKQMFLYFKQFGLCYEKFVPYFVKQLSSRQIKIFLDSLFKGDGSFNKEEYIKYTTTSKMLAEDVLECILKIGYSGSISKTKPKEGGEIITNGKTRKIQGRKEQYTISINKYQNEPALNYSGIQKFIDYDDKIYCVSVKNGTLLTERHGKILFCGNTARKNPFALLMAYFTEFWNTDNVILAIKTYRKNTTSGEKQIIKNDIENIKRILGLPKYPPVLFYSNLMTSEEMKKLHKTGDCFVLPSKGEGWGIPFAEAMSFGNPVVGPNYGGNIDFMNETNSFLIETHEEPVHGMVWMPHYTGLMTWGNPDIMNLRKIMRYVFENKEEARKIGQKGKETIKDECNKEVIGRLMINRLNQIAKEKGL